MSEAQITHLIFFITVSFMMLFPNKEPKQIGAFFYLCLGISLLPIYAWEHDPYGVVCAFVTLAFGVFAACFYWEHL